MKKIINGKKYDTDTATMLGSWGYGHQGDFEHVHEELYRKKTGELFIYGYGGPRSKYSQEVSHNSVSGGEDITPVSEEEAKEWVEKHCDADTYEEIFGPVEE